MLVLVLVLVWETPMWLTADEKQLPSDMMTELLAGVESMLTAWKLEARKLGAGEVAIVRGTHDPRSQPSARHVDPALISSVTAMIGMISSMTPTGSHSVARTRNHVGWTTRSSTDRAARALHE